MKLPPDQKDVFRQLCYQLEQTNRSLRHLQSCVMTTTGYRRAKFANEMRRACDDLRIIAWGLRELARMQATKEAT